MSIIDIKNLSLFSFGVDSKLIKLIETLLKRVEKLEEELREKDKINFEDKLKIKDLEKQIKLLKEKLEKS